MKKEFKKIAKQLGITIPACLFSIGMLNAESSNKMNDMINIENQSVTNISESSIINNDVITFLATDFMYKKNYLSPEHVDSHANRGGDHTDNHSNIRHTDNHTNMAARNNLSTNQCIPHTDKHTNSGYATNQHTNYGNKAHTNNHTNRTVKTTCD